MHHHSGSVEFSSQKHAEAFATKSSRTTTCNHSYGDFSVLCKDAPPSMVVENFLSPEAGVFEVHAKVE